MKKTIQLCNTRKLFDQIFSGCDNFLFDCDGVIWQGNVAIEGAQKVINGLQKLGKKVIFVTNNSTKSRSKYVQKLTNLGFHADKEQVFGTAYTGALYLKNIAKVTGRVYVVGNEAMVDELNALGVKHFGTGPDNVVVTQDHDEIRSIPLEDDVEAVLVGFDGHVSFSKLVKSATYLSNPNCLYLATNEDHRMPLVGSKHVIPGTGCIVGSVTIAAGRKPDAICGKPGKFLFQCIQDVKNLDVNRTIMIGDRMDTDILFGNQNKLKTLLVMTGVESEESLQKASESSDPVKKELVPDFFMPSIGEWASMFDD